MHLPATIVYAIRMSNFPESTAGEEVTGGEDAHVSRHGPRSKRKKKKAYPDCNRGMARENGLVNKAKTKEITNEMTFG